MPSYRNVSTCNIVTVVSDYKVSVTKMMLSSVIYAKPGYI